MGQFCVNIHFRTEDAKALAAALDRNGIKRRHIIPATNGWTSLYEEQASSQDDARIYELAEELTEELGTAAIAFMVHDSDIAFYWLFDKGEELDEFNSCPDYFEGDADEDDFPRGGKPEALLPYVQSGVGLEELEAILALKPVFAEEIVERLAAALGIESYRVLADYRDFGEGADDFNEMGVDSSQVQDFQGQVADRVGVMLGALSPSAAANPLTVKLVDAAARDAVDEIASLLAEGAAIDGEAPAPLPAGQALPGFQLFSAAAPKIALTPLLTAIVHNRLRAAERLLDGGADPNRVHPLFGTSLHAAASVGVPELLELLLDRQGDANAKNLQGVTPLAVIAAGRGTLDRLEKAKEMMRKMGLAVPAPLDQMSDLALPTVGWDACESLLKARGAVS